MTNFLEVGACVSLKVATKWYFGGEENYEQKRSSATENIDLSLINLALVYLVQLHIF